MVGRLKGLAVLVLPVIGCASETVASGTEDNLTAGASAQFTSAVGAVVVDGKRVCTAALVDVDAEAHIGSVSLAGRQIVVGGACVGKLKNGMTGAAAFVIAKGGVSLATPILSFDFQAQAGAGLAIGILSDRPEDTKPMKLYGVSGAVTSGASVATVLRADENGVLVGAAVAANAGAELNIVTQCTEFHFFTQLGVAVGASVAASDDAFGAAAIVQINGELHFAASIDAGCVARRINHAFGHIAEGALALASDIADGLAQAGQGELIAVYDQPDRTHKYKVRVNKDATTIQIGAAASISARAIGIKTFDETGPQSDTTCTMIGGQCEIRPIVGGTGAPRMFKKGQEVEIEVTLGAGRRRVFIATKNN